MCVAAPGALGRIDLDAYQRREDCGSDEATRWCPVYRCVRNQGINHDGYSHVRNICAHKNVREALM